MSLADEFQITLASNVTSNKRNKPAAFETALAKPLDLPGEWEVALIDLSYPHNWTNLDKSYSYIIVTNSFGHPEEENREISVKEIEITFQLTDIFVGDLRARFYDIPAGNYKVEDIVTLINEQINKILCLTGNNISYNENTHKVTFAQTSDYMIGADSNNSILQLLGLSKQTTPKVIDNKGPMEFIKLEANKPVVSELTSHIKRLTSIFVYSDVVELSLVGDSQSALLGYCPIQSKFGDQGYWCFNPPYYVRVREKNFNTITIELSTDTGEMFPIEDGKVYCRLNFRRIGLIR